MSLIQQKNNLASIYDKNSKVKSIKRPFNEIENGYLHCKQLKRSFKVSYENNSVSDILGYYSDNNIYIGKFKKLKENGKGIYYSKNKCIIYCGLFMDGGFANVDFVDKIDSCENPYLYKFMINMIQYYIYNDNRFYNELKNLIKTNTNLNILNKIHKFVDHRMIGYYDFLETDDFIITIKKIINKLKILPSKIVSNKLLRIKLPDNSYNLREKRLKCLKRKSNLSINFYRKISV